jgi:hypothetical protein
MTIYLYIQCVVSWGWSVLSWLIATTVVVMVAGFLCVFRIPDICVNNTYRFIYSLDSCVHLKHLQWLIVVGLSGILSNILCSGFGLPLRAT